MNRFWIFPIVLSIAGTLFVVLAPLEGMAPFLSALLSSHPQAADVAIGSVLTALAWGFGVGLVVGLIAGGVNLLRPRRESHCRAPLASNMVYCLFYVHAFIFVDMALVFFMVRARGFGHFLTALTMWLPGLFWLVAVAWATVRTMNSDDILSPRVLLAHLQRSAHVEG